MTELDSVELSQVTGANFLAMFFAGPRRVGADTGRAGNPGLSGDSTAGKLFDGNGKLPTPGGKTFDRYGKLPWLNK